MIEAHRIDEVDFGNGDTAVTLAISDHRPVAAFFETDVDDDGEVSWDETNGNRDIVTFSGWPPFE